MIIFSTTDGAKLEYTPPRSRQAVPQHGVLTIDNAAPTTAHIEWRMSRGALMRVALRCLWASMQRA
jgi:hypothetical protein